ncbi:MAG: Rab family GTPase [Candidatus Thermoplasmatota archaeon]
MPPLSTPGRLARDGDGVTSRKTVKSKVCLVGEKAVGKTSLIARYVQDMFNDRYIVTVGTRVSKKSITVHNKDRDLDVALELTIWDIMGEKGFRELLKDAYFYGANGILAIADLTRLFTLEDLDDWIDPVLKIVGDVPVYVAVNKVDLADQAQYDEDAVRAFTKAYSAPYVFTSAKTGENVETSFQLLGFAMAANQLRWKAAPTA